VAGRRGRPLAAFRAGRIVRTAAGDVYNFSIVRSALIRGEQQ